MDCSIPPTPSSSTAPAWTRRTRTPGRTGSWRIRVRDCACASTRARASTRRPSTPGASTSRSSRKSAASTLPALRNGDAENWFGAMVSDEPADLVFDLPNVDAAGAAEIEISIQGVTETSGADADHVVAHPRQWHRNRRAALRRTGARCPELRHPARHPHRRRQHRDGGRARRRGRTSAWSTSFACGTRTRTAPTPICCALRRTAPARSRSAALRAAPFG